MQFGTPSIHLMELTVPSWQRSLQCLCVVGLILTPALSLPDYHHPEILQLLYTSLYFSLCYCTLAYILVYITVH